MSGIKFHNPIKSVESEETPPVIVNTPPIVKPPVVKTDEPIVKKDEDIAPEVHTFEDTLPALANYLTQIKAIQVVPKDIDLANFNTEAFVKLWNANMDEGGKTKFDEGRNFANKKIVEKLSPLAQNILSYNLDNPNADDADIRAYVGAIGYSTDITSLTVEANATEIIREYYKSLDWTSENIENKIAQLDSVQGLEGEAKILKPKLDARATSIAAEKQNQAKAIKDFEEGLQEDLHSRVVAVLNTGTLNGIPLNQQQGEFLYSAIMNNETQVSVKGKRVEMGYSEALVRHAKYDPKGNMENLMLGLLVIQEGKKAIEQFYKKVATTEATEEFVETHKFSNNKKKPATTTEHSDLDTGIKFSL